MDLGRSNKVIMVATASRGLGLAIARAVAIEGAPVSDEDRVAIIKALKFAYVMTED